MKPEGQLINSDDNDKTSAESSQEDSEDSGDSEDYDYVVPLVELGTIINKKNNKDETQNEIFEALGINKGHKKAIKNNCKRLKINRKKTIKIVAPKPDKIYTNKKRRRTFCVVPKHYSNNEIVPDTKEACTPAYSYNQHLKAVIFMKFTGFHECETLHCFRGCKNSMPYHTKHNCPTL